MTSTQLDYAARLGFSSVDCALDALDGNKADRCAQEMQKHDIKHLHHKSDRQAIATAQLVPAAAAGVAAITAAQLSACADQTAFLQQQQLSNDLSNLLASTGAIGPTTFQLAAITQRGLQITQINLAQRAGINATASAVVQNQLFYGGYGFGFGGGFGIGGPVAAEGYRGIVPSNVGGGGCCR